jgi:DNA invertase Pin-like site-specific DNA recombinase
MARTTAYSYIRFSHPDQAKGNSLRRQMELAEAYCKRRGWTLSKATYRDLGVSARRGKNALVGNLGEFLKAIKSGEVKAGNVLIVESLDRISRQGIDEGYDLIKRILKAGITIVTLSPEREFDASATKSLTKGALEMQLILERAAEESEMKSKRVADAWQEKRRRAVNGEAQRATKHMGDGCFVMSRMLPYWLEERDGKVQPIPERAAVVKRIFEMTVAGYGSGLIVKAFKEEKLPTFTGAEEWVKQYVAEVLGDRRVVGEFQHRKNRKPEGDPIPGYYPAVVTEEEWQAAKAATRGRLHRRGKVGKNVNIFTGLLWNARDGDTYTTAVRPGLGGKMARFFVGTAYVNGRGSCDSFPLRTLERAVLSMLVEIDPSEILPAAEQGPPASKLVENELAVLRDRKQALEEELLKGDVASIARVLRQLEEREKELVKQAARPSPRRRRGMRSRRWPTPWTSPPIPSTRG